ncbi:hypothetical protein [Paractinoplanes lichenicola]|uniref:SWIM-type domain-containing protein n=1 Tax=Paractinoplanes lichenicola TaxID=2802976 RepID=A0ABS1VHS5_9ACTN|nr:hypothetical protein [Actinoplanes lichenicola]MBL7254257.1 hypothetical protein [Actinoplanes lichenicola]
MSLPPVDPAVTAAAVAALPARLKGRLDAAVEQASAWPTDTTGTTVTVHPDDKTTVTLTIPVLTEADAVCSCLLFPRCLHRAAVLSAAPILTDEPEPSTNAGPEPSANAGLKLSTDAGLESAVDGGLESPIARAGTGADPDLTADSQPGADGESKPSADAEPLPPAVFEPEPEPEPGSEPGLAPGPRSSAGLKRESGSEPGLAPGPRSSAGLKRESGSEPGPRSSAGLKRESGSEPGLAPGPRSNPGLAPGPRLNPGLKPELEPVAAGAGAGKQRGSDAEPARKSDAQPDPGAAATAIVPGQAGPVPAAATGHPQVSAAQRQAAHHLWSAAAEMLAGGVPGGGAVMQASLLRAAHQARSTGLHTAAAATVRVVEHLRAARREDPAFRRAELADDLRELLGTCHRLATGDGRAVGVARRDYQPVGDLRLFGLFAEPVRAATGHAGAVTYLADSQGRVWVVSDVKPAEPSVALTATRASVDLGEVRLSHHNLSRAGLRAINAHASAAGRLSHGRARQAVSAPGAGWFEEPLDALWRVPLAYQVDRWLTAAALPAQERPAAHDLAYVNGVIIGTDRRGMLIKVIGAGTAAEGAEGRGTAIAVEAPHEDPALPYVGNLRLLATQAQGHPVRIIGRFTGPARIDALAVAAAWLPPSYGGHADLGAQRLTRADVPGPTPCDPPPPPRPAPPLHLVRHQLERVVATGRAALLSGAEQDARRLAAAHLTTAAAVVEALAAAGVRRTRDVFGRLDPHDSEHLAQAWLTAAVYERAASAESTRVAWS